MGKRLEAELKQRKPFACREEEVFLNVQRTAEVLLRGLAEALKPTGLTPTQYNVLRILRGAAPAGLCCREISERMVNHDPDITRLLDRLEGQGFVARARSDEDRRVVLSSITAAGLRLLAELDEPVRTLHRRQIGHLGATRLTGLSELLELSRARED